MQYKVRIRETSTGEGLTYWLTDLTLDAWKAIKRQLIDICERYETEHELTLIRLTDYAGTHWLGAQHETELTKITTGASIWERQLKQLYA